MVDVEGDEAFYIEEAIYTMGRMNVVTKQTNMLTVRYKKVETQKERLERIKNRNKNNYFNVCCKKGHCWDVLPNCKEALATYSQTTEKTRQET